MFLRGLLGSAAEIGADLAYRVRTRLPVSGVLGGLLEDSIVIGVAWLYASDDLGDAE